MNDTSHHRRALVGGLTPLNRDTTVRYRACLAAGGHVPSERVVLRDHPLVEGLPMSICARCEVPYADKIPSFHYRQDAA